MGSEVGRQSAVLAPPGGTTGTAPRRGAGRLARFAAFVVAVAVMLASMPREAVALGLIRDAEIETYLHDLSSPVFEVAGINPDDVQIFIVDDPALNAFVAGGLNLFLNTGLLARAEQPGQLLGVIAHETGHMAGGHLARIGPAQSRAAAEMIIAAVLGAAAAVAGAPQLGGAMIAGGSQYAQSGLMQFSRSQEQAADQAALSYLDRLGLSAEGLMNFLEVLENENILQSDPPPYLLSHPLTRERVAVVESHVADPRSPAGEVAEQLQIDHERMRAKLAGFMDRPERVLRDYAERDDLPARYARTIAYYQIPDLPQALEGVDALIAEHPDDPYFLELKGQMLFENGRVKEALPPYRAAVELEPTQPLLRLALSQALIESGEPADLEEATMHLREVTRLDPSNSSAWRYLGIAEGRKGDMPAADLALAESAFLVRNLEDAELFLNRANQAIGPNDPDWLRMQDLQRAVADAREESP